MVINCFHIPAIVGLVSCVAAQGYADVVPVEASFSQARAIIKIDGEAVTLDNGLVGAARLNRNLTWGDAHALMAAASGSLFPSGASRWLVRAGLAIDHRSIVRRITDGGEFGYSSVPWVASIDYARQVAMASLARPMRKIVNDDAVGEPAKVYVGRALEGISTVSSLPRPNAVNRIPGNRDPLLWASLTPNTVESLVLRCRQYLWETLQRSAENVGPEALRKQGSKWQKELDLVDLRAIQLFETIGLYNVQELVISRAKNGKLIWTFVGKFDWIKLGKWLEVEGGGKEGYMITKNDAIELEFVDVAQLDALPPSTGPVDQKLGVANAIQANEPNFIYVWNRDLTKSWMPRQVSEICMEMSADGQLDVSWLNAGKKSSESARAPLVLAERWFAAWFAEVAGRAGGFPMPLSRVPEFGAELSAAQVASKDGYELGYEVELSSKWLDVVSWWILDQFYSNE